MGIIDLGIIVIIGISVLFAVYYGFSISLCNIGSFILSWFISLITHPFLTRVIARKHPDFLEKIAYYSEGSSKIPFSDRVLPVVSLSENQISKAIETSGLPRPFNNSIKFNLLRQNLSGMDNLGQYFDYTVVNIILNLMSFFIIFLILQVLFKLAISFISHTIELPMLRKHDGLSAGVLGLFRGVLFLFIITAFVPLLYLVVPADFMAGLLDGSKLIHFFIKGNLFTSFIKGVF